MSTTKEQMLYDFSEAETFLIGGLDGRPKKKPTKRHSGRSASTGQTVEANPETMIPCKTREEFYEFAIEPFTKIEGKGVAGRPGEVYVDSLGHPTIGIGHLVIHKGYVLGYKDSKGKYHPPSPQNVAEYRNKYIQLPLLNKNGQPMSDAEKGKVFDNMISLMKTKKRALTNAEIAGLGMGHLDEDGMKEVFSKDVEWALERALKDHGDKFWEMTRSTQASLVHGYFWGKSRTMSGLEGNAQEIGKQMPQAVRVGLNPNHAIRDLADQAAVDSTAVSKQRQMMEFQLGQQRNQGY